MGFSLDFSGFRAANRLKADTIMKAGEREAAAIQSRDRGLENGLFTTAGAIIGGIAGGGVGAEAGAKMGSSLASGDISSVRKSGLSLQEAAKEKSGSQDPMQAKSASNSIEESPLSYENYLKKNPQLLYGAIPV